MPETIFHFQNNKILLWRLGGINSVKQTHWGKTKYSEWLNEDVLLHQPPVKRGLWCFPFGLQDYFFAWGQWKSRLPKRYLEPYPTMNFDTCTDEEAEAFWAEKDAYTKKIQRLYPPSKFWYGGAFYSHIGVHNQVNYEEWYYWDNAKEWAKLASKHLYVNERDEDGKIFKYRCIHDHLELFIPNY